jgi:hypothetical protein
VPASIDADGPLKIIGGVKSISQRFMTPDSLNTELQHFSHISSI